MQRTVSQRRILISSLQHAQGKQLIKLNKRRTRDAEQLTSVEGVREAARALTSNIIPHNAFICPDLIKNTEAQTVVDQLYQLADAHRFQVFDVSTAVYQKMAYRGTTGGILLVIPYLNQTLDNLPISQNPFLAIIDGVEKPGNLGAILRTADAAGVDGLILTGDVPGGTDIHNPNVIRASLGALFSVPVVTGSAQTVIQWLREKGIQIVVTTPDADELYTAVDLHPPTAIIMGSEAHGLLATWLNAANQKVRIPMHGLMDSLNLSTATALLFYEVVRQRNRI